MGLCLITWDNAYCLKYSHFGTMSFSASVRIVRFELLTSEQRQLLFYVIDSTGSSLLSKQSSLLAQIVFATTKAACCKLSRIHLIMHRHSCFYYSSFSHFHSIQMCSLYFCRLYVYFQVSVPVVPDIGNMGAMQSPQMGNAKAYPSRQSYRSVALSAASPGERNNYYGGKTLIHFITYICDLFLERTMAFKLMSSMLRVECNFKANFI